MVIESRVAALAYLVAAPPTSTAEQHPILVFLHGYDEGPPTEMRGALTRHGPLRRENTVTALHEFIIVAPQMPVRGDGWFRYAEPVAQVVREVKKNHGGDRERIYLTGFSFGGNGVFDLAVAQPNLWAALWAVDPTRVPEERPSQPVWLSFGAIARRAKKDFIATLNLTPADEDFLGDFLYLDHDEDHAGSARLAYNDATIYQWLLSKRLAR